MAAGKKRAGKKKNYYAAQVYKTESNKNRQGLKRKRDKEAWVKHGIKKNGREVLTVEQKKLNKIQHIAPLKPSAPPKPSTPPKPKTKEDYRDDIHGVPPIGAKS